VISQAHFAERQAAVDDFNKANRWRKRGLAVIPTKFGISFTTKFLNQGAALVHIYTDGTVLVTHGGVEMGQGLHTKVAQVRLHPAYCAWLCASSAVLSLTFKAEHCCTLLGRDMRQVMLNWSRLSFVL